MRKPISTILTLEISFSRLQPEMGPSLVASLSCRDNLTGKPVYNLFASSQLLDRLEPEPCLLANVQKEWKSLYLQAVSSFEGICCFPGREVLQVRRDKGCTTEERKAGPAEKILPKVAMTSDQIGISLCRGAPLTDAFDCAGKQTFLL